MTQQQQQPLSDLELTRLVQAGRGKVESWFQAGASQIEPELQVVRRRLDGQLELWVTKLSIGDNRYEMMAAQGLICQSQSEPGSILALALTTEAWVSVQDREPGQSKPLARVQPRLDPNRKEVVMIAGMTHDRRFCSWMGLISRLEPVGGLTLTPMEPWDQIKVQAIDDTSGAFQSQLLEAFWDGVRAAGSSSLAAASSL